MEIAISMCVPARPGGEVPLEIEGEKWVQKSSFPLSRDGRKFVMEKKDGEDNSKNIWYRDMCHRLVRKVSTRGHLTCACSTSSHYSGLTGLPSASRTSTQIPATGPPHLLFLPLECTAPTPSSMQVFPLWRGSPATCAKCYPHTLFHHLSVP